MRYFCAGDDIWRTTTNAFKNYNDGFRYIARYSAVKGKQKARPVYYFLRIQD